MNSSTSSETPPLFQRSHDTATFTKYGLTFILHITTETRAEWASLVLDLKGNQLNLEDEDTLKSLTEGKTKALVNWELTGGNVTSSYVTSVQFKDHEDCHKVKSVELFSTNSGPILGIVLESDDEYLTLLDPAVISFENNRKIVYTPIFNVGRHLRLHKRAIHSRQAPAEVITAGYPGYILQNRMFKNQLKPLFPFATTEAAKDESPLAVEVDTE